MDRGIGLPLATAAVRPAHAEPACTLTILHLPENRLDALPALAIEAAAPPGPQLALHARPRRHPLRHAPARRRRLAQGRALLVVLLRGDEQLALFGLGAAFASDQ